VVDYFYYYSPNYAVGSLNTRLIPKKTRFSIWIFKSKSRWIAAFDVDILCYSGVSTTSRRHT